MEGLVLAGIVLVLVFIGVVVVGAFRSADTHHPVQPAGRHSGRVQVQRAEAAPRTTEARVPGPPPARARRAGGGATPVDTGLGRGFPPGMPLTGPSGPAGESSARRMPGIWSEEDRARAQMLARAMEEVWLRGTPIVPSEKGSRIDWQAFARGVIAAERRAER
jgi:hypothetical protein